jgi:predicted nuclease of restriction endonuclease-like (RecB) superfamily
VTERTRRRPRKSAKPVTVVETGSASAYDALLGGIADLLEEARRSSARAVNALMTATYWEIGRRIVEFEQAGKMRAAYGEALMERLSADLAARFGRGFSVRNVWQMKAFYLAWRTPQTLSAESESESGGILQTVSAESTGQAIIPTPPGGSLPLATLARAFPLPWSAYVRLLAVKSESARRFYETEALRGGWSVRQLDRQIQSQFYERTALSRNKAAMLAKGARARPEDVVTPEEEVKDPYVLEFLGLKDEYSESDLEEALIRHLETFLLELGGDFCFAGRQKRLRIGDEWYRVDLVFYHRRLRCLVLIDLKLGRFTHADAGQMHTYLNYAAAHWMHPDENPPVGLILCAQRDEMLARYALDNLSNKVLAAEYRTVLPDEKVIAAELAETRRMLEARRSGKARPTGRKRGMGKEGA